MNMITVKDAFIMCDIENVKKIYAEMLSEEFDKEEEKGKLLIWYHTICEIEEEKNTNNVVIPQLSDSDEGEYIHASIIHKEDLKEFIDYPNMTYEQVEKKTDEELHDILMSINTPDLYAFEFEPWKTILGYSIPYAMIDIFGLDNIMAAMAYEMTFFGYGENRKEEEKEEIIKRAEECEEMLKKPKEEQEKYFIPFEKVMEELGWHDDRTEEEKANDKHKMYVDMCINKMKIANSINEILMEVEEND